MFQKAFRQGKTHAKEKPGFCWIKISKELQAQLRPCLVGPLSITNRDMMAGAKYKQVMAASSFPFSLLCISDRHVELLMTFEPAQFHCQQPKATDPMLAISTRKLPKDLTPVALSRNLLDELSYDLQCKSQNGTEIISLNVSCLH